MRDNASVLVVDDEPILRGILTRIVGRAGYSVASAVDGLDALEKLKSARFDIVISDVKMPNMDGLELLGEIKSSYPETSVILITGKAAEFRIEDALKAGADHFIVKPLKNVEVARTLMHLHSRRQRQKLRR